MERSQTLQDSPVGGQNHAKPGQHADEFAYGSLGGTMNETHHPMGGSGLLSTAEDYFRFAQMLLNGGRYNGKQILGSKTVEFMTQDHIQPGTDTGQGPAGKGSGYGLGVGIVLNNAANGIIGSKGQFGWGGYTTTSVIIDPEEDMISILMSQRGPAILPIWHQFQTLAYQAIID